MLVRLICQETAALEGPGPRHSRTYPPGPSPMWATPMPTASPTAPAPTALTRTCLSPPSEYLTFVLRAMGYDSGTDFAWDSAWTLSDKLGITDGQYHAGTTSFDRGDVAWISANALTAKVKDSDKTLEAVLADQGFGMKPAGASGRRNASPAKRASSSFPSPPPRRARRPIPPSR